MASPTSQPESGHRYRTSVRVRWSDLDSYGHVNNANTLTLLEEARVDWLFVDGAAHGAARLRDGVVVSHAEINYLRPISLGRPVEISMGVLGLRRSSVTIDYRCTVDDVLVTTAKTVLVPINAGTGRARRWDEGEVAFLTEYLATTSDVSLTAVPVPVVE